MRVVASLTTMPDRYFKIINTLKSLQRQTYKLDAIYLSLPDRSRRLNIPYPPVPPEITKLCTVVPCTDFGPITKILGGLLQEEDPDTVIITFDDDMIYPRNIVEALMSHHKTYPNSAIGSSGMLVRYACPMCAITPNENTFMYRIPKFPIPAEGRKVDSIYGYPGALYIRKFFPAKDELEAKFLNYALVDNDMLMNDDIVISGYLSLEKVERRIFRGMPEVSFVLDEETGVRVRNDNEISYDIDKFFQRMTRSIAKAKSIGMYAITEPVDVSETIAGISIIVLLSIIIVIILMIYIFSSSSSMAIPLL